MTVWSRLSSRFSLWHIMQVIGLGLLIVVFITTIILVRNSTAAPYTDKTITFTARLRSASGGVVPDGLYNLRFSIYGQESGGSALWSETYIDTNGASDGQDFRVQVTNGYLSVRLGSQTAFGTSINWGDNLWLTMSVGDRSQTTPDWDSEMTPRIQLTATPYALNSSAVGGKTADELVQLGQGKQTDSSNNSSVFIDKTGSGNLVQLQASGNDMFTINNSGNITLGGGSDKSIAMGEVSEGAGNSLTISAGTGSDSGGDLILQGGNATNINGDAGNVQIDTGTGNNGSIALGSENATTITLGNSGSTTTVQGDLHISNIDSAEAGELVIGGNNATSINLGQDTSVDGSVTVKKDSDVALQVQNTSGDSVLNVDTQNNRITLGKTDDIATLLVLDTKTGESDPTGTNGAMYYNQSLAKFRCYEDNAWRDCITPLPVSVLAQTDTTTDSLTPVDVEDMTFELAANTKYYYKFIIIHEADSNTAGVGFGVTTPENVTMNNWCVNTTAITSTTANPSLGSYCGVGDADAVAGTNSNSFTSTMEGYIQTGNQTGDLKLRMKSGTASENVTIKEKSFGMLQIVQ